MTKAMEPKKCIKFDTAKFFECYRSACLRAGLTVTAAGSIIGVDASTMTRMKKGQLTQPKADTILAMSIYAGLNPCDFVIQSSEESPRVGDGGKDFLLKHGCSAEEYEAIPYIARRQFVSQRNNSYKRGIEWRLTIYEWWNIWQKSGKYEDRGRGKGFVMARRGDVGPYSPGNVYICTSSQNIKDSYIFRPASERKKASRKTLP